MNGKRSHNLRVFTNFLAYLVLILIAVLAIIVKSGVFSSISGLLNSIKNGLAYFLVGLASFWYVMSKRSVALKIVWFVAIVTISVLMFI